MVNNRKRILVFIDWFYPAYKAGGPVKSVYNIVNTLGAKHDFRIVTSNLDIDGEQLEVEINSWAKFNNIPVLYLEKHHQNRSKYLKIFEEFKPDIVYYNSLFSYKFTLLPYYIFKGKSAKQLIAPRGMLGQGALAIKSLKKKVFLTIAKTLLFEKRNTVWHATSILEKEEIQKVITSDLNIIVAQNLSSAIVKRKNIKKREGELKLVFVSRLAEKKNLLFALELMQQIKEINGLALDIYGPIEDRVYWDKCKGIIDQDHRISYKGVLKPHEISNTLQNYHYYILPTLHENYGHSIVEALVAGVPIIISKNTPWQYIQESGIGIDLDLNDKLTWENCLVDFSKQDENDYSKYIDKCYEFVEARIFNEETQEANQQLFNI